MGSTGKCVLIVLTIGSACAGYSDNIKPDCNFQKDTKSLESHDFDKFKLFNVKLADNRNNKRSSPKSSIQRKITSTNKDQSGPMNMNPYYKTNGNHQMILPSSNYRPKYNIEVKQTPQKAQRTSQIPKFPSQEQLFGINQEPLWFHSPMVSVEHAYDVDYPTKLEDQEHSGDNCHKLKHQHEKVPMKKQKDGEDSPQEVMVSDKGEIDGGYSVEEKSNEEEVALEPKKNVEDIKANGMEMALKKEVPEPVVVKVPMSQGVPVPIAITIYKLVPEMIDQMPIKSLTG